MAVAWFGWSKPALALPRCPSLALVTMAAMAAMPCAGARLQAPAARGPECAGKAGETLDGQEPQVALRTWDLCLVILGSQAVPWTRLCCSRRAARPLSAGRPEIAISRTGPSPSVKEEQRKQPQPDVLARSPEPGARA